MYNWSTDEQKFRKVYSFLKTHPRVETLEISRTRKSSNHLIFRPKYMLRVKLDPTIHPAIKTTLAMTLQETIGDLGLSVVEKK